jgi:SAM-dependent methyltransferase
MSDINRYTEQNRRAWNETAEVRSKTQKPAQFFIEAAETGLDVRFIATDLYALPIDLQQNTFDYVYTGGGVMVWLPDLTRWAQVIIAALKPGGKFILFEEHPVA